MQSARLARHGPRKAPCRMRRSSRSFGPITRPRCPVRSLSGIVRVGSGRSDPSRPSHAGFESSKFRCCSEPGAMLRHRCCVSVAQPPVAISCGCSEVSCCELGSVAAPCCDQFRPSVPDPKINVTSQPILPQRQWRQRRHTGCCREPASTRARTWEAGREAGWQRNHRSSTGCCCQCAAA